MNRGPDEGLRNAYLLSMFVEHGRTRARNSALLLFIIIIEMGPSLKRHKLYKRWRVIIQGENVPCIPQRTNRSCLLRGSGNLSHLWLAGTAPHNDNLEL